MATSSTRSGLFIVLEGIDGAGTTSQLARLASKLQACGEQTHATREPSDGPVGRMLREIMRGTLTMPSGGALGWEGMALLFAADRRYHLEAEIEPALAAGTHVLSDRYDASSLAYQSVTSNAEARAALAWIRELNRYARRPDLTIVLDVPASVAAARRHARGGAAELYETDATQAELAVFYRNLRQHMHADCIEIVSGEGSIGEVQQRVDAVVATHLPALRTPMRAPML